MVKEFKGKLIMRIKRTPTVESFRFKLEEKLNFKPGQFAQVIFDQANRQNKELNKYLSFSSSPLNGYVEFTKRLSQSLFTKKLLELSTFEDVLFKAPLGDCVLEEKYKKIGFLIGGIGITPVVSIIEFIVRKELPIDVRLLYSNKSDNDIAFKNELDLFSIRHKSVKVIYSVTECEPQDKVCIFGPINKDMVKKHIVDFAERMFYIFGPPRMVGAMKGVCLESGCKADSIKTESFIGY
ncbi:MAG: FAD-dependent oxidoreductase [Candidatus Omnitrophota bacterium]